MPPAANTAGAAPKDGSDMFARGHSPDTKRVQGIRRTQLVIKYTTYSVTATFFLCYFVGTAYVQHQYGEGFLERLEESNRSKRISFWRRRNDAETFQTRKSTDIWTFLGLNSFSVTADDD
jgi:hypothetical protein